ncbi:Las1-domain-containing protein [Auriculariales sp. MPI-PUGE-AT-0066]|nr:Las1-domain-containing protein [Auriculariales sp. MPI-PUGE-AT-0066]
MRLPRRVPWAALSELEQVCTWIFSDESAHDSRAKAAGKALTPHATQLAAWRVAAPLPHALESALSFLAAELSDDGRTSALVVRQAYASAMVRFVNGLVDARQYGVYARSIAAIASEIDLPSWFVEIRHAATHEDLPSLEILRDASREALQWLLHHYFMPTLSLQDANDRLSAQLASIEPELKAYKELAKRLAQDESLRSTLKPELDRIYAHVEKWLGEARIVATGASDDSESLELAALEELAAALLGKGGLVPLAKTKRVIPEDGPLRPPNAHIWSPLLQHLQDQHPLFASALITSITSALSPTGNGVEDSDDLTTACQLGWLAWTVQQWKDSADLDAREAVAQVLLSLQPASTSRCAKPLRRLLHTLLPDDEAFHSRVAAFIQPTQSGVSRHQWQETDVAVMKQRLAVIQQHSKSSTMKTDLVPGETDREAGLTAVGPIAPGWRRLSAETGWKERPIGLNGLA